MHTQTIMAEQLLADSQQYAGKTVTVAGRLMASFYDISLVPEAITHETYDLVTKILINAPDLAKKCFSVVSPWGGGRFYYQDKAVVTGTFVMGAAPALTDLTSLTIFRETKEYKVL